MDDQADRAELRELLLDKVPSLDPAHQEAMFAHTFDAPADEDDATDALIPDDTVFDDPFDLDHWDDPDDPADNGTPDQPDHPWTEHADDPTTDHPTDQAEHTTPFDHDQDPGITDDPDPDDPAEHPTIDQDPSFDQHQTDDHGW